MAIISRYDAYFARGYNGGNGNFTYWSFFYVAFVSFISRSDALNAWSCSGYRGHLYYWDYFYNVFVSLNLYQEATPMMLGTTTGIAVVWMPGATFPMLLFPSVISRRDANYACYCYGYYGHLNGWYLFYDAFVSVVYIKK